MSTQTFPFTQENRQEKQMGCSWLKELIYIQKKKNNLIPALINHNQSKNTTIFPEKKKMLSDAGISILMTEPKYSGPESVSHHLTRLLNLPWSCKRQIKKILKNRQTVTVA